MKITKHQPDQEGIIRIRNAVTLVTMGLLNDVVTIWAITDPLGASGLPAIPLVFVVKKDGDSVTPREIAMNLYVTSFINDSGVRHLYREETKINPAQFTGPQSGSDGKILK